MQKGVWTPGPGPTRGNDIYVIDLYAVSRITFSPLFSGNF